MCSLMHVSLLALGFAAVLAVVPGCVPLVSPPAHIRVGAGRASKDLVHEYRDGTVVNSPTISHFSIGFDSTAVVESPIAVELGFVSEFRNPGGYFEVGYVRRVRPKIRVGASGAVETWGGSDRGARVGLTLEYIGRFHSGTDSETSGTDSHSMSTMNVAWSGAPGIGGFVDAGYRSLPDEKYSYVVIGVSIRLPGLVGFIDATGQH